MLTTTLKIRVEWAHCDPAKIIFNPHYYIWMDHSTHGLLKVAGLDIATAIDDPEFKACPLVTSSAEFHAPAVLGDQLLLSTSVSKFGNTSFHIGHSFTRNDTTLCTGQEVRVWGGTDSNGKLTAVPLPNWIKQNLSTDEVRDISV